MGQFGLIKPDLQEYSPIIYDNFLSVLSYTMIYSETLGKP